MENKRKIKNRNIVLVYIFWLMTLGIYKIYWHISTKNDMNSLGAKIPTGWLIIIPFVNIYWIYKYSEGYASYLKKDDNKWLWFILFLFVDLVRPAFVQSKLNNIANSN